MKLAVTLLTVTLLTALFGCSNAGQPFNTPNSAPVCIAAAGLDARVADLQALDPATSTTEQYLTAIYGISGAVQTLVAQARVLAAAEAGQLEDSFSALQRAAQALPPGTDLATARTELSDEIAAARSALSTLNTKLACPPLPTAAPA